MTERQIDLLDGYWKRLLEDFPVAMNLPLDHSRSTRQSFRQGSVQLAASPDELQAMLDLAELFSVTPGLIGLVVWQILLARYCDQDDIVIGADVQAIHAGDVALVVRADVEGAVNFKSLLTRVSDALEMAAKPPAHSFDELLEHYRPDYIGTERMPYTAAFCQTDSAQYTSRLQPVDLSLHLLESTAGLTGQVCFNAALFEVKTIERLVVHYKVLLSNVVSNLQTPLLRLPMLPESERHTLLAVFNRAATTYPSNQTMVELFAEQSVHSPQAIAVEDHSGRKLTYVELDKASNQLARYLQEHALASTDDLSTDSPRVGIYLERDADMVVAILAILKAGAAYVPLDPMFPPDRLKLMAEDARLSVIVTQSSLLQTLPGEGVHPIALDNPEVDWRSASVEPVMQAAITQTAFVIYTSGSTGRPKGVLIGQQSLTNLLCSIQNDLQFSATDRLFAVSTLSFDIASLEMLLPLISGGCTVVASKQEAMDPKRLGERLVESRATVMQATPATWRMLLEEGWAGKPDLKIISGGEAMPRDMASRLIDRVAELWNNYGPSETTIYSTAGRVPAGDEPVTIGKPIANTQVHLLNAAMELQPVGLTGELYIGGDGVSTGYLERPELTAERFIADTFSSRKGRFLYRTGDCARWREDGSIELMGRADEQVKLRGFRIEPGEIRARLIEQPGIANAIVILREDTPDDARLTAYTVPSGETEVQPEALRSALQSDLPDYMIPTAWVALQALPLTPNGKVDKLALPAPASKTCLAVAGNTAPQTETEAKIATVWAGLLKVESPARTDNFFNLGGNSLKAIQLVSRIRNEFLVEIPLLTLFENPTIVDLAVQIDALAKPALSTGVQSGGSDIVGFEL